MILLKLIPGLMLMAAGCISASAQPIKYSIAFPNASHHEAEVTIDIANPPGDTLLMRMSRSSPGRYALHEFAKNVYNVRATTRDGETLHISRPDPHQWHFSGHGGKAVVVRYTIFGDRSDGTYLGIDNTHAHMNMPATFMWPDGLNDSAIEITFEKPNSNWKIATQLRSTGKGNVFTAPNLDYFLDSPTEISDFALREWQIGEGEQAQTIRLAMHHAGTDADLDAYTKMAQAIVREQLPIFGEAPRFDFGTYTFIADYRPHVHGDGMEHRNSTILTSTGSLREHATGIVTTLSHEFLHAWNIERIRPASLEPFDFTRANMSGELWFGEGFTVYYAELTLIRAGILSIDNYAKRLGGKLNYVVNGRGQEVKSVVEMSQYAPFVDAGSSIDAKNLSNTYISYYPFGGVIALGLDLQLRKRFPGITLDSFMQAVWQKYGKPERPFRNQDLQQVLAEVTGDADFAGKFFDRYVFGRKMQEYEKLLALGGLRLRKRNAEEAWLGSSAFSFKGNAMRVNAATVKGTPLYTAGIAQGDLIHALDGDSLQSQDALDNWLADHKPGDTIEVRFTQRGKQQTAELTLQEDPALELVPYEHLSMPVTPEMASFRAQWLGSQAGNDANSLRRYCPTCRRDFAFRFEFCKFDGAELQLTLPNLSE